MKVIKKIDVGQGVIEMIQGLYEDYRAKQDLLTMLFELHKLDEDETLINSKNFEGYEKKFMKAKIAYDTAMKELQQTFIPEEFKQPKYQFEVNFIDNTLDIQE